MADRVAVLSPEGQFGTVDAADAEAVTRAGGKVLTKQELAAREQEEKWQAQSPLTKAAVVASMAGPAGYAAHAYLRGQGAVLPPELEALTQGVSENVTGGFASVGMKEAVRLAGGDQAAKAYAQTAEETAKAFPEWHAVGAAAGLVGSAIAGGPKAGLGAFGKAIPGIGIGAVGGAVEQAAARGLAGVAERGVLGRALATGGQFAARGAAEGALYAGAQQVSEDMLGDKELAADKVFAAMGLGALAGGAGGFALGGAGSLAASGARAAGGAALGSLSRVLRRGAGAAEDAAAKAEGAVAEGKALAKEAITDAKDAAAKTVRDAAESAALKPEAEVGALQKALRGDGNAAARDIADDLAWNATGAMKKLTSEANEQVPGGARAVGRWINERVLKVADDGATLVGTTLKGRADEMLPLAVAERTAAGERVGQLVAATPVRVHVDEISAPALAIAKDLDKSGATIGAGKLLREKVAGWREALVNAGAVADDGTVDLVHLYRERAAMEAAAYEARAVNKGTEAYKGWLREYDNVLVNKLDEAAKAAGEEGAKEAIRAAKRDYQLASWAVDALQEGADRVAGNNTFGIRESIGALTGIATGNPIGGIATAIGGKILRERGAAAGAFLLNRMAEMQVISRAMAGVDDLVGKAATGMLGAPAKVADGAAKAPVQQRASMVLRQVAEYQKDPAAFAENITRRTERMGQVAPTVAAGLAARASSAVAFLASKVPASDPDPLDPHPAPKLTDAEAHTLAQYGYYTEKPARFFEEASRGKLTFEGAEVAQALMPGAFREFQARMLDAMATKMAEGARIPFQQREKIGMLLGVPATPSQRPEHMALLQANVSGVVKQDQGPMPQPPKRPAQIRTQQSSLDRLEAGGLGRR